jgi:hypothetical protein
MIAAEIIGQVLDAGGQIAVDGADLVLTAPRPLPADLLDTLKAHKPDILAALAHPDDAALWWRVAILEPGGRTVEVDTPSGWTLPDWQAYAERQGAARKSYSGTSSAGFLSKNPDGTSLNPAVATGMIGHSSGRG